MLNNKNIFSWLNFFKKKKIPSKTENSTDLNTKNKFILNNFICNLQNVKNNFSYKIRQFFFKNKINDVFFEKLEEKLLQFDFGVIVSKQIVDNILNKYKNNFLKNEHDIYNELKNDLFHILENDNVINSQLPHVSIEDDPYVILLVGVNGVGKTTIAAKLAYFYKNLGKSVALVGSDTFRAAAIEQIKFWGKKISIPVFFKNYGTDPSSVIFDSIDFARLKGIDILIIDTAGRLHNNLNLIQELQKNVRVIKKKISSNPHEILLVLDARNGQNSLIQTELFVSKIQKITGIILTKLDGTAKGGIVFAILKQFFIPIQYFSNGEKLSDFYKFHAKDFIENMFS